MHAALRVLLLGFGATAFVVTLRAQSESLPPIFAPRAETKPDPPPTSSTSMSPAASERVRQLIITASTQLLADVKVFAAPGLKDHINTASPPVTVGNTVQMRRFVVRSTMPSEHEVRPPDWLPPRFTFFDTERDDRRMIGGKTMTLLRFGEYRELNLNLIHGSGRGSDHSRDFIRGEIEFRIRF